MRIPNLVPMDPNEFALSIQEHGLLPSFILFEYFSSTIELIFLGVFYPLIFAFLYDEISEECQRFLRFADHRFWGFCRTFSAEPNDEIFFVKTQSPAGVYVMFISC